MGWEIEKLPIVPTYMGADIDAGKASPYVICPMHGDKIKSNAEGVVKALKCDSCGSLLQYEGCRGCRDEPGQEMCMHCSKKICAECHHLTDVCHNCMHLSTDDYEADDYHADGFDGDYGHEYSGDDFDSNVKNQHIDVNSDGSGAWFDYSPDDYDYE